MTYLASLTPEQKQWLTYQGKYVAAFGYPDDVCDILQLVCDMFSLRIPQHKKQKGFWIDGARQLQDACGKRYIEVIKAVHADWELEMKNNGGIPKWIVSSPLSLVKMCRAKEAMLDKPQEMSAMARRELEARKRIPIWLNEQEKESGE